MAPEQSSVHLRQNDRSSENSLSSSSILLNGVKKELNFAPQGIRLKRRMSKIEGQCSSIRVMHSLEISIIPVPHESTLQNPGSSGLG